MSTFINSYDDMVWLMETHLTNLNINWKPRSAVLHGNEDSPDTIDLYPRQTPKHTDLPLAGELIDNKYVFCGHLDRSG